MQKNIVVICENEKCEKTLKESAKKVNCNIEVEIQQNDSIMNEISLENIQNADAILFVIDETLEDIKKIERFIDLDYYEVEPSVVISNCDQVLKEILEDININLQ